MDICRLIRDEAAKLQRLHAAVHETFVHRDRDARSRQVWSDACEAFHTHVSAIDGYLDRACDERRYVDRQVIEFSTCFLEVDPWFFRSGFLKQELLTRLKRSDLDKQTRERLRAVLIDAVNRRGTREFRYYCRLAVHLATFDLVKQLQRASVGIDRARASRARMMLKHIARHAAADALR